MRSSLIALLFCPVVAAQVTSPRGLNTTEGNTVFSHWTGSRRFQQIDYTQNGAPMLISSVAWRRNGGVTQTAVARTFDFTVEMGHTSFGAISHKLDDNFFAGTRTTVFSQTAVSFPDWSANVGAPAPFDFTVPLSTPFVYNGADALVIDFSFTNNSSSAGVSTDRDFTGPTTPTAGTLLGTGCIATGNTGAFTHNAWLSNANNLPTGDYGMRLRMGGTNAPASSGVLAWVDYQNENLSGVLCSTLYALPVVQFTMVSQPTGTVADVSFGFSHDVSLVGGTFFTQFVALDLGISPIPLVVSNGRQITMPVPTPAGTQPRCSYGWSGLPSTTGIATQFVGGGLVMLLQ